MYGQHLAALKLDSFAQILAFFRFEQNGRCGSLLPSSHLVFVFFFAYVI